MACLWAWSVISETGMGPPVEDSLGSSANYTLHTIAMSRGLEASPRRPRRAVSPKTCRTLPGVRTGVAPRSEYRPALAGLRALAVAAVIAYHLGLPWARGGYLGVDLFFVLSGLLITGLLFGERERTGRVELGAFYARRARRLLPALLLVLAAVVVYTGIEGSAISTLRGDVVATLGYVANWRFVLAHQGYFAQFSTPSPLRHTWSLAIEEQYYLLWPLLLLALVRLGRGSARRVLGAIAGLAVASAVAMGLLYHPGGDPSRAYYGTDARAFELVLGSALALWVARRPGGGRRLWGFGTASLVVLGFAWVRVADTSGWMYRGGFVVAALLAAVVVASVARPDAGPLGRLLSRTPLRRVGRQAYALCLWHWRVIALRTHQETGRWGSG